MRAFGILDSNSALSELKCILDVKKFTIMILIQLCRFYLTDFSLNEVADRILIRIWNHQALNDEQVIIIVSLD